MSRHAQLALLFVLALVFVLVCLGFALELGLELASRARVGG